MIERKIAKNSEKRIRMGYQKLKQTVFQPGNHFKYIIDNKKKEIVIVPSTEPGNTVSRRALKEGFKPLIDIRKREAVETFSGMDFLEVIIHEDKIIVRGFKEEKQEENTNTAFSKIKKAAKKIVNKVSNVIDITERIAAKQKFEVVLSKKELANVVGGPLQQLSIFDILEASDSTFSSVSTDFKEAIDNAKIPLQVASLFSGAGIMDLGFKESGFDLVFALENNKDAAKTYRYNLGNHMQVADIREFDLNKIPKVPVMIFGSPCTAFSNANRSNTRLIDHPDYDLVERTIASIKTNDNLKVFAWENVPEILTALDGAVIREIQEELSDFEITYGVLNSASFGAPQLRRRAFIIGSKIGKIELPKPELEPKDYMTVREAFVGLDDSLPNQMDFTKPRKETLEKMKHILPGRNWEDIPDELKTKTMFTGNTHSSIYRRLEWDKPSISLPNVRKSNIMPPEGLRSLSVRECARLFGVADSFVFKGLLSEMQKQICNAVTVPLSKAIAKVIKVAIQQFNIRNGFEKLSLV